MKVSMKLIVSFVIVVVLAVIVGAVGIFGMLELDRIYTGMYDSNLVPLPYMSNVTTMFQQIRVNLREFTIGAYADNLQQVETARSSIDALQSQITTNLDAYQALISNPEVDTLFTDARARYDAEFDPFIDELYQAALTFDEEAVLAISADSGPMIAFISDSFAQCMEIEVADAASVSDANTILARTMLIVIIAALAVAVILALILAFYISGIISRPLTALTAFMTRAGSMGDITLSQTDVDVIQAFGQNKDETGQCIAAVAKFMNHITEVSKALATVADGDLTVELTPLSDADVMGISLQEMTANLNSMFNEIKTATSQVSTGSSQIADGAQALAQGSTEQAATVQELSATISEIAKKTQDNAVMAGDAANLANSIMVNAEKGSRQMDEMITAVNEINQASQSISQVIKTIDNIAFQTNILALNASVEAARAGQHGKGFAVVAEEVRNLATKSAEAAKDTGDLIANSVDKATLGARIASDTAASLTEIVSGITESSAIVSRIAASSDEQNYGIRQINDGIEQVTQVVQQNSATAEQSAASSQELSSQSSMLNELIGQFRLRNQSGSIGDMRMNRQAQEPKTSAGFALSGKDTVKY
jgi:methyl-accepting chemotaxis protein